MPNEKDFAEFKELYDYENRLRSMVSEEHETSDEVDIPYCSFCGKSKNSVKGMVRARKLFICNECVKECQDILERENENKS